MTEKKQAVEQVLSAAFDEIMSTFPAGYIKKEKLYLAGGCIYSLWHEREPKDFDIFCVDKSTANKVKKHFAKGKACANCETSNAITYGKYQFITKYIGPPEKEVSKFDFMHNMNFFHKGEIHTLGGWEYLDGNRLVFNSDRSRDVLNILTRVPKFVARGMEISQQEMLDMLEKGTRPTKIIKERKYIKQRRSGRKSY